MRGLELHTRLVTCSVSVVGSSREPGPRELEVNSSPSLVLDWPEGPIVVIAEAVDGRITSIWVRLNPDKTAALKDPLPIV